MKPITATLINLYHVCKRQLWLHANEIRLEHSSDVVLEGKLIGETSYSNRSDRWTEIALDGIKIDYYDARKGVVHEVKKSNNHKESAIAQVKYYLYVLEKHGMKAERGILEFPTQRERMEVLLTDQDRAEISRWLDEIEQIITSDTCPGVIHKPICKKCSFYEFCYIGE